MLCSQLHHLEGRLRPVGITVFEVSGALGRKGVRGLGLLLPLLKAMDVILKKNTGVNNYTY